MIPALLAAPMVQGVVGSLAGSVAGTLQGLFSHPSSTTGASASFNPYLEQASQAATSTVSSYDAPSGALTTDDWAQMSPTEVQSWMQSLTGKYVHATDVSGRTVSGVVSGVMQTGGISSLNVGGHLVTLSQVNQVAWSPAIH